MKAVDALRHMNHDLKNNEHSRYRSVDFIKGVCIIFIVVTHCNFNDIERLKYLFPFWIDMAVPVFMVLSGFVYGKSFQRKRISSFDDAYSWDYIIEKITRYTIPFAFVFGIELLLSVINNQGINIFQIGFDFLCGGYGPGSYYYPIMIQFIFLVPVIFITVDKHGHKGLVIFGIINFIYEVLKRAYLMNAECYRLLCFRYIFLIAYGCYLSKIGYKRNKKYELLVATVGMVYIVIFRYLGYTPIVTNFWSGTSFWAVLLIIPLVDPLINSKVRNNAIETIGKASYNIFLTQMIWYNELGHIEDRIGNRWLGIMINAFACISVGLIFYVIETPITKKIIMLQQNSIDRGITV